MMNPSSMLDLARERRRELLETASRSRQWSRHDEPQDAAEVLVAGSSAHAIQARVRAEARRTSSRLSAPFDVPVGVR